MNYVYVNLKFALVQKAAVRYAFKKAGSMEYSTQEKLDKAYEFCDLLNSRLGELLKQDLPCTKSTYDSALVLGYWTIGESWYRLAQHKGDTQVEIHILEYDEHSHWWQYEDYNLSKVPDQLIRSDHQPEANIALEFDCEAAFTSYIDD